MLNGAASDSSSKITKLEIKQASIENLLNSETESLRKDIDYIKNDVSSIKKTVDDINTKVVSSHGYVMGFRFALPYFIALIGVIVGMAVFILVENQNKVDEKQDKRDEQLERKVDAANEKIYQSNKAKN